MADKDAYYERERAPFRVVIDDPGGLLPLDQQSCPMLLIRLRYPSGWTRIEEAWRKKCRQEMAATPALGVRIIVEMALEGTELALGDNEVEVSAVAKLRSRSFLVSSSAKSHWNVADPATIERKWGPRIKGLAVALALDKDTFELGHDIPLHIAMANFEAESSVFGSYPIWDPPAVGVELRDSCGAPVQPQEGAIWLGHGLCGEYQRGKIVPNELSLRDMGFLPKLPGSYTLIAIWRPSSSSTCAYPPYATVESAPVSFRVVDENHREARAAQDNTKCAQSSIPEKR
jgi:hypothetical protein